MTQLVEKFLHQPSDPPQLAQSVLELHVLLGSRLSTQFGWTWDVRTIVHEDPPDNNLGRQLRPPLTSSPRRYSLSPRKTLCSGALMLINLSSL